MVVPGQAFPTLKLNMSSTFQNYILLLRLNRTHCFLRGKSEYDACIYSERLQFSLESMVPDLFLKLHVEMVGSIHPIPC